MPIDRRQWMRFSISASTMVAASHILPFQQAKWMKRVAAAAPERPGLVVATWPFGLEACQRAYQILGEAGRSAESRGLDAVEAGVRVTESDVTNRSVGVGGLPNAAGVVQLDACIMDGQRQRAGSVAALEGFSHPISVARLVMERTRHAMLVGPDAGRFAHDMGCERADMPVPQAKAAWEKWKQESSKAPNHDTIALLVLTGDGQLAGGCSTSGMGFKLPGRVGDSPLIGGGLYVDGRVGAAGATGIGENILRYCGSFLAVEFMRQGASPEEACQKVIQRIAEGEGRAMSELSVNFVAIDRGGRFGAAGTDADFRYSLVTADRAEVLTPRRVS
jgi:N4-(beta-N-acetylglucosaminyl)-L-asparaginase